VTGADVPETELEIMNPEVHLFTIEGNSRVSMELGIGIGRGYESADKKTGVPAGTIALDSAFSPITKVSYNVEMSRLGKITDYEKLVIEIWTNGAVSPEEALERSATFLREHFTPLRSAPPDDEADAEADGAYLRDALGKSLEELDLAARAVNALKAADIVLVADLAQKTEADLAEVKNLGEKTIDEIKAALAGLGLSLGMRIDPNVLGALGRGAATK
jgi:DNA-directed RNA polymerase subunit alpha